MPPYIQVGFIPLYQKNSAFSTKYIDFQNSPRKAPARSAEYRHTTMTPAGFSYNASRHRGIYDILFSLFSCHTVHFYWLPDSAHSKVLKIASKKKNFRKNVVQCYLLRISSVPLININKHIIPSTNSRRSMRRITIILSAGTCA